VSHAGAASSRPEPRRGNGADEAHSRVVRQLMFNRILSFTRLLSVEGVTVVHFDPKTGTLVCSLAGVNVVVSISSTDTRAKP